MPSEPLDFLGEPEAVRVLVEAERLSYGHLFNPAFATEISQIDPLPHQRIAVYDRMLPQPRLRFLLADDAGAGKTIMTGLYLREALARRTLRRVLVVAPAGLVGNWQRELSRLFQLRFAIVSGADARARNPFIGAGSDHLIVSIDSLRAPRLFRALADPAVQPYDFAVFDEAHKLSARRDPDGTVSYTDRYRLAEAIAGVRDLPDAWRLPWSVRHLLLLTATPHMGKPYPYYALWRLLEPELLGTETAFERFPPAARARHFIRRVKEEMLDLGGKRLFPERVCDTLSYDLTQGEISEQTLYDRTTAYIRHYYNSAQFLNRQAARFAATIFQRRLASSTWALLCSLRKRLAKVEGLIEAIGSGAMADQAWLAGQRALERRAARGQLKDLLEEQTADEDWTDAGQEAHESNEDAALGAFLAANLEELRAEREELAGLVRLAEAVHTQGHESKFERLRGLLETPDYRDEKIILYTEHRDTLDFLTRRLEGLGYAGQVAFIHGGLGYAERDAQVERFRADHRPDHRPDHRSDRGGGTGGARFFIGTDAAAEGINLQFCGILINYDVPWNPARLEQRMGRIHRYGQRRDQVAIVNLVAGATREGRVVKTLLDKLETIRQQLGSDKVFDVVGRLFQDLPLAEYLRRAIDSDAASERDALAVAGQLTPGQVQAIAAREASLYGRGGEVAAALPRLREAMEIEALRRLLPGYCRRFLKAAAPRIGLDLVGDLDGEFLLRPRRREVLEPLLPLLETYPESARHRFTLDRPADGREAIFLYPGDPLFDRLSTLAIAAVGPAGRRGAIFTDPGAQRPYLFHVARVSVVRAADPGFPDYQREELVEQRLVGLMQGADHRLEEAPVERLLLLRPGRQPGGKLAPETIAWLAEAEDWRLAATEYLDRTLLARLAEQRRLAAIDQLTETRELLGLAFDYETYELAAARKGLTRKAREGDHQAQAEIERIRARQARLSERRHRAIAAATRAVELIRPGRVEVIATCLVQPSQDPDDIKARDLEVERIAVEIATAAERASGAQVRDVSTPERARLAGLTDYPGFDLLSRRPGEERGIEVKGRVGTGPIELTENEWAKACNLRGRYWLYVVFDCGSASPRLFRVQDPFGTLFVRAQGGVQIGYGEIACCAIEGGID